MTTPNPSTESSAVVVTLRDAAPEDSDAITRVFLSARADMDYLPRLYTDEETAWWVRNIVLENSSVRVALAHGELVGFLARNGNEVEHLYVQSDRQGRDIGTALLQEQQQSHPGLTLWVFAANERARRFYERKGFVAAEFTDGERNEEKVPDVRYVWTAK